MTFASDPLGLAVPVQRTPPLQRAMRTRRYIPVIVIDPPERPTQPIPTETLAEIAMAYEQEWRGR